MLISGNDKMFLYLFSDKMKLTCSIISTPFQITFFLIFFSTETFKENVYEINKIPDTDMCTITKGEDFRLIIIMY